MKDVNQIITEVTERRDILFQSLLKTIEGEFT
jgi:hypothetical protein